MITCDNAVAREIEQLLAARGIAFQSSEQRNLDGLALTEWLVLARVAVKTAPDLIRALTEFIRSGQIKLIEWGNIRIETHACWCGQAGHRSTDRRSRRMPCCCSSRLMLRLLKP
jgi:hypothetical protein